MKLIITEGGKDALTLGEAGYPFVISVPNGAAGDLHKSFEAFDPWLDYAQSIVICGDTDLPGRTRTKYLSDYFGNRCLLTMLPHDCKDISGVVVKYGIDVVREIIDTAKPQHTADIITVGERKEEVLNVLWDEYDHGYDVGCDPLTNHVCRPAHQVGAHAAGWNDKSLGICYEGGLDEDGHPADTHLCPEMHPNGFAAPIAERLSPCPYPGAQPARPIRAQGLPLLRRKEGVQGVVGTMCPMPGRKPPP